MSSKHLQRSRLLRAAFVFVTALTMLTAFGAAAIAQPARTDTNAGVGAPATDPGPAVKRVIALPARFAKPKPIARFTPTRTTWPAASTSDLILGPAAAKAEWGSRQLSTGSPVWAEGGTDFPAGGHLHTRVLDRSAATAAGVDGVLFTVTGDAGTDGKRVRLGVNYGSFAEAYGGNYGLRLRLVQYPACVLTTPAAPACHRVTPLKSINDPATSSVSAAVAVSGLATTPASAAASSTTLPGGGAVFAVQADSSVGDTAGGSYSSTGLKPSGSWTAGGSDGSFTYNYPIAVPPAASGLAPKMNLSYNSGSPDGQTASTQAQANWAGDGWSTPSSFVEESFASCAGKPEGSSSPVSTSDECYDGPIMTLSLNGATSALVWDSATSVWKPKTDAGQLISHVTTGGDNGSGTYNHDHWTVTTTDGTVYSFGLNHLPGWTSGKPATNSVAFEPVYSAHAGDPCYSSSGFTSSVCTMAYRWNLDYAVDAHGNAMSFYYQQDTNYYGEDNGAHNVAYVRDSHLDHIDYGFTDGNAYATAPDRVQLSTEDRCLTTPCDPLGAATKANWPDVPFDLVCASGATCTSFYPAFFSTVRLSTIATQQWSASQSRYVPVDTYALTQAIPPTGDGTSPTLWLAQIVHTGSDTTGGGSTAPIALPPVQFGLDQLQNRVDTSSGLPAFYRYRIGSVTTETGSVIGVSYGLPYPCAVPVTITASNNTSNCYPISWTPPSYDGPITDWFNKYAVVGVTQTDPTGGALSMNTSYAYPGRPAWHYDDNEMVKASDRTYGQFRGYREVQTFTGDGVNDSQTAADTVYYQGMSKDNNATVVNVTDSQAGAHEDIDQLSGKVLEQTAYKGKGGPVDHSTITSYWVSPATATRSRAGLPDLTANLELPVETWTRQAITDTGTLSFAVTETDNSYDATPGDATYGDLLHTYTHTVPIITAYSSCATDTYALPNTAKNLVGLLASAETDSVACGGYVAGSPTSVPATSAINSLTAPTSVTRPDQVVSASRVFYDNVSTWSTAFPQTAPPTVGDVTLTQKASGYSAGAFTYQTLARTAYDSFGRVTDNYDGLGNDTHTAYTTTGGLTTAVQTTDALGHSETSTLDTERGLSLARSDINAVVTTQQFDALGRVTSVWQAGRPTTALANATFSYQVSNTGVTAQTSKSLNEGNTYNVSTTIYDGLMRVRQTQTMTPLTGRMVTDNFYDSRGWMSSANNGWWDPNTTPNTTVIAPSQVSGSTVPNQEIYTYDGLGRAVIAQSAANNQIVSTTTTVYNGDTTTVIPPPGGEAGTTREDPLGRTAEIDNYTSAPTVNIPANTFTGYFTITPVANSIRAITYGYDGHGNQATVTQGASGSGRPTWTSSFNLLGQLTSRSDPDAGGTPAGANVYDADGHLLQTTDTMGHTLSYTYDALGRKTASYDADTAHQATSNELASWVYDNANAVSGVTNPIGRLTTETAYWGGAAYVTQQTGFNAFGESLGEKITIPSSTEGGILGTTYAFSHTYLPNTGRPAKDIYPALGGLPAETVIHGYNSSLDLPNSISGGYLNSTSYDAFGRINQLTLGSSPNFAYLTNTYDPHTGRLTGSLLTRTTSPTTVDDEQYAYDLAGNETRQVSTRNGSAATAETQCFVYDGLDELTSAWTANDNCATAPTPAAHAMVTDDLGTSSAYWTSWSFDALGDRTQQVQHAFTGGPASDTTTAYTYDGNAAGQPHTLTSTTTTGGASGSTSYSYNAGGEMTSRNGGQGNQSFVYDDQGRLTGVTGSTGGSVSDKYDAEGSLLIETGPSTTTLYLPDEQIVLSGTVTTGTRYYGLPGGGTVIRTGTASTAFGYALTDQHGTPTIYLDHTGQTATWRQYTPYGGTRGTAVTAPDNRGFLNKPGNSVTGLATVGARQYDTGVGRFTTLDPMFEADSNGQLNGYSYTANNPVGQADPDGLMLPADSGGSGCTNDSTCSKQIADSSSGGSDYSVSYTDPSHCVTALCVQEINDAVKDLQGKIKPRRRMPCDTRRTAPCRAVTTAIRARWTAARTTS